MATDALLNRATSSVGVADVALAALDGANSFSTHPRYWDALNEALAEEPPPFGTERYAELFQGAAADPVWVAVSLITNAEREGDGAQRLWSLSACSVLAEHSRLLKFHAADESRHALFYLALLEHAFPGMTDPAFKIELQKLSPGYTVRQKPFAVLGSLYAKNPTIDEFIQMNIAEIRTTIHHLLQREALAGHVEPATFAKMRPILDALLGDELKHVRYTAQLIEDIASKEPDSNLRGLFRRRLKHFNEITESELGEFNFDCSVSCCERHQECRAKVTKSFFVASPL